MTRIHNHNNYLKLHFAYELSFITIELQLEYISIITAVQR